MGTEADPTAGSASSPGGRAWGQAATRFGRAAVSDGQPTRWYEEVWSAAERDEIDMPWDRDDPHPALLGYLAEAGSGSGRRAVVVGAGRGADAEHLARHGWRVTAFDISAAAVRLARRKHPGSLVEYRQADLLALPEELVGAFDLVVEVFTVQALAPALRAAAVAGVRSLLAPGGQALVVQMVHRPETPGDGPPWLLTRAEMESFGGADVTLVSLRQSPALPDRPGLWLGVLQRAGDLPEGA